MNHFHPSAAAVAANAAASPVNRGRTATDFPSVICACPPAGPHCHPAENKSQARNMTPMGPHASTFHSQAIP